MEIMKGFEHGVVDLKCRIIFHAEREPSGFYSLPNESQGDGIRLGHFTSSSDSGRQYKFVMVAVNKHSIQSIEPSIACAICNINESQIRENEQGHKHMILTNLPSSEITQPYSSYTISSLMAIKAPMSAISSGSKSARCPSLELHQTLGCASPHPFQFSALFHNAARSHLRFQQNPQSLWFHMTMDFDITKFVCAFLFIFIMTADTGFGFGEPTLRTIGFRGVSKLL